MGKVIKQYEIPGTRQYSDDGCFSFKGAWVVKQYDYIEVYYLGEFPHHSHCFSLNTSEEHWEEWLQEEAMSDLNQETPTTIPWFGNDHYYWKWRVYIREVQYAVQLLKLLEAPKQYFQLEGGIA